MRVVSVGECMVEFLRQDDGLWRQGFAGDTLNVAWAMRALLGPADVVDYLTRVGRDGLSDALLAMLAQAGIATGHVTRDDNRTLGLYTIQTDAEGEREFSYWRDSAAARGLAADAERLRAAFAGADLVYLSGITLAILPDADRATLLATLGVRGARGFRLAFDPNIRPRLWPDAATSRAAVTAAAQISDILLPTHDDEALAFGDADAVATRARYVALGVPEVVVKDGTRPTLWHHEGAQGACPVARNAAVIDTTGAGDSFGGTYLARRLLGDDPAAAVGAAQRVSAMVVGQRGALIPPAAIRAAAG